MILINLISVMLEFDINKVTRLDLLILFDPLRCVLYAFNMMSCSVTQSQVLGKKNMVIQIYLLQNVPSKVTLGGSGTDNPLPSFYME